MKPDDSFVVCILLFLVAREAQTLQHRHSDDNVRHRVKRVVGGDEAQMNSWPWIVTFIDMENLQQCAGTIINREWILSAAHCHLFEETPFPIENYTYHVADHKLNFTDNFEYNIHPSRVYTHPKFILGDGDLPGDYDIALLKLSKPLNFSEQVRSVNLPDENTSFTSNDTCYVVGWGNTKNVSGYHRSSVLMQAKLNLVSFERCNSNASYNGVIPKRFICAGFQNGGVGPCSGDSGGPLQCERNGTWTQVGIVSWGKGCAKPNNFGVYSDVKRLLPFIREILKGPNEKLVAYLQKTLLEIKESMMGYTNLHKLFTNDSYFSDIDLVRNLQLLPKQVKLLNKTTLMDLVFVSTRNNLTANATTLNSITVVFLNQANRLNLYEKSKNLAQELNITFDELVQLSNRTKDDLLNSKTSVLEKVRKMFYIKKHMDKLQQYKKKLLSYNTNITITLNISKTMKDLNLLSLEYLKKLDEKSLKLILVEENKRIFTEKLTIRNLSSFFEFGPNHLGNMSVIDVSTKILNISSDYVASTYMINPQQINAIRRVKISSVKSSDDLTLLDLIEDMLKSYAAQLARCGHRNENQNTNHRVKRVIGGMEAQMNLWPWIVNFYDLDNLQRCAGAIIDREWILTAAHCYPSAETPFPLENYTYHVADHKLNFTDHFEYNIHPSRVYVHPKFILGDNDLPGDYDIALLKLSKPLNFSEEVRPVCLPENNTSFLGNGQCYLIGWGNTKNVSKYHRSSVLMQANLDLVPLGRCNSNASYKGIIPNRFLCAGFQAGEVDGCSGDSGGPLQCERNGTWTQIGIVSWGKGCAEPNNFGVYSDVEVLLPFISAIRAGPNVKLVDYLKKTLMEIKESMMEHTNLHKLFTNDSYFSDIDLVRNLQLLPKQVKLLNKTTLMDLVFVSMKNNLTANATTLNSITVVFLNQANRLNLYEKSKNLAQELNITFDELVQLSNRTKDDLLNSKTSVLEKVRKMFYIKKHMDKLQQYKKKLLSYNTNITITLNISKTMKDLNLLSLEYLKKLDEKSLKLILVEENKRIFTEKLTIRNLSSFFEFGPNHLGNMSVIDVSTKILNISSDYVASTYMINPQQINAIRRFKISSVKSSDDLTLLDLIEDMLKSYAAQLARCGHRNENQNTNHRVKRVIGGMEAQMNLWPWIVNFYDLENLQQCAGAIIDREWILTAAHCYLSAETPFPLENYTYHVADHKLNFTDHFEYNIHPSRVYVHPKFILGDNDLPGDYDIALLKLSKPLNFSEEVRSVCLPENNTSFLGNGQCYLIGWGNTKNVSKYHRPSVLMQANLDLVPLGRCNSNASYKGIIPNRFLCAGFQAGEAHGCSGDSGGPLQCERNGTWTQIGIMSWGKGCAEPNNFGVYSDVEVLLPFISAIRAGPNVKLVDYLKKTLMEIKESMMEHTNLHKLFTNDSYFSDIDLVRNLQLLPKQVKLLNKTTLMDLVFVSMKKNLTANATTLNSVAVVFLNQANRLNLYEKSKNLAQELNITFDELVQLSNRTKDDLLNSKISVLEKVRKMFYIKKHMDNLRQYKEKLLSYNTNITITLNISKTMKDLNLLSLEYLKELDEKSLKLILVKENKRIFTEKLTIRNLSSFFEFGPNHLGNMSVIDVSTKILNISSDYVASTYMINPQQINAIRRVKISSVKSSDDLTLLDLIEHMLKSYAAQLARCGHRNENQNSNPRVKRVIGGMEAQMNLWPWIVNFYDLENLQQCAGAIIDREWILTAAHCYLFAETPFPLENYTYHVADHKLNFTDHFEYNIHPSRVYVHPKFILGDNDLPGDYDIALLKLSKPLTFSEEVRPVCLPDENTSFASGDTCYVVGWGNTKNVSKYHRSSVLKQAKLNLISFERCNGNVSYNGTIPKRFICAGFQNGGVDACSGDSGGPLQCERNGTWTQVGIVSWGKGCAEPNNFGVYSDIEVLLPFIRAIRAGPNVKLVSYLQKTLMEIKESMMGHTNLHKLFTNDSYFSDVDLVRNLQLVPKQVKLLNKTTLMDLVFVSMKNNLTANATTLNSITGVFIIQTNRLNLYEKIKKLAQELNITFDELVQLSNQTKDDLLNSKTSVLEKLRKMFYIKKHMDKLRQYKEKLLSYNTNITITLNNAKTMKDLNELSLEDLKKLDEKSLKLILVKENKRVFTEKLTVRNLSIFFEFGTLRKLSVIEVSMKILNISVKEFGALHELNGLQLNLINRVKISSVSHSNDRSLYAIAKAILDTQGKDECSEKRCSIFATCANLIGSFSCRCKRGYVGNGFSCLTGNTMYSSVLRLNETFTPSLDNPDSTEYTNLAAKIQNGISQAVTASKSFKGFVGTQVTGFRKGSVLADYLLVFSVGEKDKINVSQLSDVIYKAIKNGSLSLPTATVEKLTLSKTDLCQLGSHNCHKDANCAAFNDGFTCKCRNNFYGDGVHCEDPCNKLDCHANSYCHRGLQGDAKCICDTDFGKDANGKCERMNAYKIALIVVSCVAGLLLLILFIILVCRWCTRHARTAEISGRNIDGMRNTGYDGNSMNLKEIT